jgi:DNA-binding NtrC family response regulator
MTSGDTQYTILVVDDEADIRLMMEDILGVHYRVLSAVDGQDALDLINARPGQIDLVMTDLRMPRLDGMELVEQLRRDHPRLGIIMISAHGTLNEAVDALKRGVFDYITKPLPADLDEVYAKCERFFKLRALELEQERLQRQILELSYFPRFNPHFVARLSLIEDDALLLPGNDKTRALLSEAAGALPDVQDRFNYRQGAIAGLFPEDLLATLRRIAGTEEVIEIDGVEANKKHYHHTYTPFIDDANEIFVNITDITERKRAEQALADEVESKYNFEEIISQSEVLQEVLRHVELVAPMDTSALILGETGTGKELICRAIHHLSQRQDKPLVKLNCAAIPSGLIESELFGHEKGSFTGAIAQKQGRFELAHEGTIFLDEIGDIPLETQPKLLRLLQE